MNNKERNDLDRHITGNYGEDSIETEPQHPTFCTRCGGDSDTIISGYVLRAAAWRMSDTMQLQVQEVFAHEEDRNRLRKHLEGIGFSVAPFELVLSGERVPDPNPCKACIQQLAHHAAVVEVGGVHWYCHRCTKSGVLHAEDVIAQEIRKEIPAPIVCAVEFEDCDQHQLN